MLEHPEIMRYFDEKLALLEEEIRRTQESRREYINRNNLNKTLGNTDEENHY